MKSEKELQNKITELEMMIFEIKIYVNSNYCSGFETQDMMNKRIKLKKQLYLLKKSYELKKERKKKLDNIYETK